MVNVTLVKPNTIQKLDRMNIITKLKVLNHCFRWPNISIASKNAKAKKNLENFEKLVLFTNGVT